MRCLLLIVAFLSFTTPAYAHHIYSTKAVQALEALVASDGTIPISTDSFGRLVLTQPLLLPAGTAAALPFRANDGAGTAGLFWRSSVVVWGEKGVERAVANSSAFSITSGLAFAWTNSTTNAADTKDTYLSRADAGHVKVTT